MPFGNYKVYTGLIPWCAWIVDCDLFGNAPLNDSLLSRYNLEVGMLEDSPCISIGFCSCYCRSIYISLFCVEAAKSVLGWWGWLCSPYFLSRVLVQSRALHFNSKT